MAGLGGRCGAALHCTAHGAAKAESGVGFVVNGLSGRAGGRLKGGRGRQDWLMDLCCQSWKSPGGRAWASISEVSLFL